NSGAKVGHCLGRPEPPKTNQCGVRAGVESQRENPISECVTFHSDCAIRDMTPVWSVLAVEPWGRQLTSPKGPGGGSLSWDDSRRGVEQGLREGPSLRCHDLKGRFQALGVGIIKPPRPATIASRSAAAPTK